jgi:hypothetical protein
MFAADSFWYQALPKGVPLSANSDALAAEFARQVRSYYGHVGVNTEAYSSPIYIVGDRAALTAVSNWPCQPSGYVSRELEAQWSAVPIPPYARPAAGSDAEMAIYQPSTDTLWEFWRFRKNGPEWQACWGGTMPAVSQSRGIWTKPFGASATGLPFAGGQVTIAELRRGEIDHVIGIALVDAASWETVSWPANRSDGYNPDHAPNRIAEGQRFRLDPTINVARLKMSRVARVVATAAQKYGFVVWDKAGAVSLRFENPLDFTVIGEPDPYPDLFRGVPAYAILNGIPWDRMQFLAIDYGKP